MLRISSFFLIFIITATTVVVADNDDDSAVMLSLLKALKKPPSGWSSDTQFCEWDKNRIKCDSSNRRVTYIDLSSQNLAGTLPSNLNSLTQLTSLNLYNNAFSGPIPSLANLSSLKTVNLGNNQFNSVPPAAFSGLPSLQQLAISYNSFLPWTFPSELTQLSNLNTLDLDSANINGNLPDIFSNFTALTEIRLAYNNLTGELPNSLATSSIQILWLNNNNLTGSIAVIANMTQLSQVWLHVNKFTGPIPDLSQCTNLLNLQLRDNQLTGLVPDSLMNNMPSLQNISLRNNELQGPFPDFKGKNVTVEDIGARNNFCLGNTPGPCNDMVMVLLQIAKGFGYPVILAQEWKGNDPCPDQSWRFVTCDKDKNIVSVILVKQNLQGTISPAFANLKKLKKLNLSGNNLTGSIPQSLTTLSQLESLDVSNNNLSGQVPNFSPKVTLVTGGNVWIGKDLGSGPNGRGDGSGKGNSMTPGSIAGIVIGVFLFVVAMLFVSWKCYSRKRLRKFGRVSNPENGAGNVKLDLACVSNGYGGVPSELQSQSSGDHSQLHGFDAGGDVNPMISIHILRQVTNDFSDDNILGRGGFGIVYKGELPDGTKIAVKRMISVASGSKGLNEFEAEIAVLTKVRHRHLVALMGYCINGNERLLVYEHMPQGTLTQHLFECREHGYTPLTWKQRLVIALDVGRGVEYLHSLARQSFIHRDLKPSNILLGDDMRAKVADFGLVKNTPDGKYSIETKLAGTFGYLAPEYAATGRVTTKVDVYAFGVVLMELITGRKALDDTVPSERSHLVTWFRRVLINKEDIPKAIDPTLNPDEETMLSIYKVAELAGHCTVREPYQRPDMGHAVNVLGPLVQLWKPTTQTDEGNYGVDNQMNLPEALQRWQAGTSTLFSDMSFSQTQTSSKSPSFAGNFDSPDCR
ncbi:receptor protein kinase TMK1-like protein [Trifolium pratense]|uniref:non-specific serine/threonine protein kinase n=1 Tax=Trifolium pratense TaxID=57577 RepID=A0A2K3MV21_TRIPR|nr:receptor protein kinase TMK1-like protein [Trifolium pratense]